MTNVRHNMYGTKTYKSWSGLKHRCNDTDNKLYGGRGITYSKRWEKFELFLKDMGICPRGMSIDRINVNGKYTKSNCRWATNKEQSRNRRNTVLVRGKTLSEWSELLGIGRSTLSQRLYAYGWSVDRILSK